MSLRRRNSKQSVAAAVEDDDSVGEGQRWGPLRRRGRCGEAQAAAVEGIG